MRRRNAKGKRADLNRASRFTCAANHFVAITAGTAMFIAQMLYGTSWIALKWIDDRNILAQHAALVSLSVFLYSIPDWVQRTRNTHRAYLTLGYTLIFSIFLTLKYMLNEFEDIKERLKTKFISAKLIVKRMNYSSFPIWNFNLIHEYIRKLNY